MLNLATITMETITTETVYKQLADKYFVKLSWKLFSQCTVI